MSDYRVGTLLGQGAEFAALLRGARATAMHHGLLLEGPKGFGKSHAAHEVAAALLCSGEAVDAACASCPACRKVDSGNHPDLHWVTTPEDKQWIPVEAVRELRGLLALRPVEGRARVVIIDPADRLTEQGQNALLKTLEEPADGTFVILAATRPEGLLPTVRSRVARYRMRPLDEEVLARRCSDHPIDPERKRAAVTAAHGSLGLARDFCADGIADLDAVISGVLTGQMSPYAAAAQALHGAEGRAGADKRARTVLRRCAALCRTQLQTSTESKLASGATAAYAAPSDPWVAASEVCFAAEEDLSVEISAQHTLGELFLCWSEIFAGRGHGIG